jgi:hypothetical protein
LTIRTVSQTQNAAKAIQNIDRAMAMPDILPALVWGREGRVSHHHASLRGVIGGMDRFNPIRLARRLIAALAWCISLALIAVFWFGIAKSVIWKILKKVYEDIARAVSKVQIPDEHVEVAKAFVALIAAAFAIHF